MRTPRQKDAVLDCPGHYLAQQEAVFDKFRAALHRMQAYTKWPTDLPACLESVSRPGLYEPKSVMPATHCRTNDEQMREGCVEVETRSLEVLTS